MIVGEHQESEFVDAHCHVDLYEREEARIITEIETAGVHTIAVTNAPSLFYHTQELSRRTKYLYPAVGLHPELVASHGHELPGLLDGLEQTRFVGEVGLDYVTPDEDLRNRQRVVFGQALAKCAEHGNKVITVHSRRAVSDVLDTIGRAFPGTLILHWFSGTARQAQQAVDAGCWFSVNPAMLRSTRGKSLAQVLPRERVLTETDGPFVRIGARPARPPDVRDVVRGLAGLWGVPFAWARTQVSENFRRAIRGVAHDAG